MSKGSTVSTTPNPPPPPTLGLFICSQLHVCSMSSSGFSILLGTHSPFCNNHSGCTQAQAQAQAQSCRTETQARTQAKAPGQARKSVVLPHVDPFVRQDAANPQLLPALTTGCYSKRQQTLPMINTLLLHATVLCSRCTEVYQIPTICADPFVVRSAS